MDNKDFFRVNQDNWNDRTKLHIDSEFYDLDSFKLGKESLKTIELNELGDLTGKEMLHLQCHFGLDTLSWARRGVNVTGVDFSNEAICFARKLNDELNLNAKFVCANVYDVPILVEEKYDIVFTSYGILSWLPDLTRWAEIIHDKLKNGGAFYIVEQHPICNIYETEDGQLKMCNSYFDTKVPSRWESEHSYVRGNSTLKNTVSYTWEHSLSEIVNSLINVGLHIDFIHEFPFSVYEKFPGCMIQDDTGWWRLKENNYIPMLFSLKATKI